MTMNKILVIGNLGRDPEMRYTPNGQAVTNFSVATNRRYTASDGEQKEETEWFRISVWGKQAETCNQYLTKGQKVYVEGRLKSRSYETRDGQTRFENEIFATDVRFLSAAGSRADDFPQDSEPAGGSGMDAGRSGMDAGRSGMDADDLPF